MMNWMMVFQVFRFFRNFIKSSLVFMLVLFCVKERRRACGEQAAFIAVYWMLLAAELYSFLI